MIRPLGINSVSFSGTNLLEKFKGQQTTENKPAEQPKINGSEAMAAYNKAMITPSPAILNELKPAEIVTIKGDEADTLEGEKVFQSDGTLEAIVQKGDKTTKEYHFFHDKQLSEIIEKDNETGKIVKRTNFGLTHNKLTAGSITEYDLKTGAEKYTAFAEGQLEYVQETKNGLNRAIGFNEDGTVKDIAESDVASNAEKVTAYNKGKIESIKYLRDGETVMKSEYSVDNGEVIQYTKEKILVPDFDLEKIKSEMVPFDINSVKIPENIDTLEGEKKFRSNGTLESIEVTGKNGKSTKYDMSFDGKHIKNGLETENGKAVREFTLDDNAAVWSISEWNGDSKKTTHYKDGKVQGVSVNSDGILKDLGFARDGKTVRRYNEWNSETQRDIRFILLDKNGEVTAYTKDTPDGYVTIKKGLSND